MALVGGKSSKELVYRILGDIFGPELAKAVNFTGISRNQYSKDQDKKLAFKDTSIHKLVRGIKNNTCFNL